jgi:hypothetical protein
VRVNFQKLEDGKWSDVERAWVRTQADGSFGSLAFERVRATAWFPPTGRFKAAWKAIPVERCGPWGQL